MGRDVGYSALLAAYMFVEFAIFELQDFLTTVWNLGITDAAGILNVWGGITRVLVAIFLFLKERWALLLSTAASSLGIAFVALSTLPIIARVTKSCKDLRHECITGTHKALFSIGMLLLAVGVAGNARYFRKRKAPRSSRYSSSTVPSILLVVAAAGISIGLHFVESWSVRFGVSAIIFFSAAIFFYWRTCKYMPPLRNFRDENVGEAIFLARMLPVLLNVAVCGIVSSTGNTYFVEQAKNMNPHLGRIKFPLVLFQAMVTLAKAVFVYWIRRFFASCTKGYASSIGIGSGMILGILCCITAAIVEMKRLSHLRNPMSMFWLVPQFILLCGMDSWLEESTSAFFRNQREGPNQFPRSTSTRNIENLTLAALGLGYGCGVGLVRLLGFISGRDSSKSSWFQHTLDRSRLDRYYWVLAALSAVNFVVFVVLARYYYSYQEDGGGSDESLLELGLFEK